MVKNKTNPNINPCIGYQMYREPKSKNSTTDAFYNVEKKIPESQVAIPTLDAVIEAKKWVDDVNKM